MMNLYGNRTTMSALSSRNYSTSGSSTPFGCRSRGSSATSNNDLVAGDNLYGYAIIALCLFGVLGNMANIIVLADRRHNTPTFVYLLFLSLANFIALLNYCIDTLANLAAFEAFRNPYFYSYVVWPIGSLASTWSLVTAVALAVDRYFFVDMLNKSMFVKNGKRRACFACLWIWSIATVVSLPRMLAVKVHDSYPCVTYRFTTIASSWLYKVYSNVRLIMFNYGSIVLLVIFNCLLIQSIIDAARNLSYKGNTVEVNKRRQKSLTTTVIVMISMILVAEVPCTLLSPTSAAVLWGKAVLTSHTFRVFHVFAVVIMLLEYSCSFLVLCLCSEAYRRLLIVKLGCDKCKPASPTAPLSMVGHLASGALRATSVPTTRLQISASHSSTRLGAHSNNNSFRMKKTDIAANKKESSTLLSVNNQR